MQTASGYDVAWKNTEYRPVHGVDHRQQRQLPSNLVGAVSGNSYALESLELVFNQDLNGDGLIGPPKTVIQTDGSTSLTEVANLYFYLDGSGGSGPALQYNGANVTAGEFGGWTPIGAVQTASGYDVAWKNTGTGQYTVWTTDSNGNYTGNLIGAVSGNSYALESLEPIFNQDLNGDGVVGLYAAPGTTLQISNASGRDIRIGNDWHWRDARTCRRRFRFGDLRQAPRGRCDLITPRHSAARFSISLETAACPALIKSI